MTQGNKNGTLILSVERGNEINIEYSKKEIIDKINSYFGYRLIDQIKLQTFKSTSKKEEKTNLVNNSSLKFKKKIDEIKNKNLRNTLFQLIDHQMFVFYHI